MKLKLVLFSALCAASLAACQNSSLPFAKSQSTDETTNAEQSTAAMEKTTGSSESASDTKADSQKAQEPVSNMAASEVDLNTILDLMGQKDSQVVAVLGEGTPSMTDESMIIGRDYTLSLFDEDVSASLFFNPYHEGNDELEQCTINLSKNDLNGYEKILEGILGKPSETYDKSYFFATDNSDVVLANPYDDMPYIEITLKDLAEE